MTKIPTSLRQLVIQRAQNRCEYCGISQVGQVATFHIDHIIPVVAGGETTSDNLALACVSCSLRKGARQQIKDSETGEVVNIFNPRQQRWHDHFAWNGVEVIGLTPTGRATVNALHLNRPTMLAIRVEEELLGRHPPPTDMTS
ncbi:MULTISPECIES: HNH endonuclease signature motif containing protein [unclassified Roseofilum]|uniref:HNH endonuclease n=1 Tax=unclassified Roseofilum TaxID=2620099 RepID=UPI000E8E6E55|nr:MULTISPECIES: HNH endonuclease signature motif containing protein [unclassified Roseofilum]MBP0009727.1 HNH endonuclease [Roseofilum sp. Belize Diploria]MBP0034387.1 HNH endonuclease [Roseofilum sp. Belize BBD 4]HBR00661.1 HNH endonuclease [Cyanobacteria bacterium UBA11691]